MTRDSGLSAVCFVVGFLLCFFCAPIFCWECQVKMVPFEDPSCETPDRFAKQYLQSLCAQKLTFWEPVGNVTLGPIVVEGNCSARTLVFFLHASPSSASSSSLGEEEQEVCEGLELNRVYRHGDCFGSCSFGRYVAPFFDLPNPCPFDEPQESESSSSSSSSSSSDASTLFSFVLSMA
ncbi:hypothetical protein QOT17_018700 [Balamuthia mandrillaris]